jgi:LPS export ABC transporter protein LptC
MSVGRRNPTARLLGVAAALGSLAACDSQPPQVEPSASDSLAGRQRSAEIRVIETRFGIPRWILEADSASHDEASDVTALARLRVTFFDDAGDTSSVLTARAGEVDRRRRHLVARRDVRVRSWSTEGYELKTEALEWDNERKKILSDQPVEITRGRDLYRGIGLISDPSLEDFEIQQAFEAIVLEEEERGTGGDSTGGGP